MIVDPSKPPIPRTATLVDKDYHAVTVVTLPEMDWPPYIRWWGRIFVIYPTTRVDDWAEPSRMETYREVKVWDAP